MTGDGGWAELDADEEVAEKLGQAIEDITLTDAAVGDAVTLADLKEWRQTLLDESGGGRRMTDDDSEGTFAPLEVEVRLTDHNRTDAKGNPLTFLSTQRFTAYELAQMGDMQFAEHCIRLGGRGIIEEFRGIGGDDE